MNVTVSFWDSTAEKVVTVKYDDYLWGIDEAVGLVDDLYWEVPCNMALWRMRHLAYS
jgi:hypothetical protein